MKKVALVIAGLVFAAVALVHAARLVLEFPIVIGDWVLPRDASVIGLIVAGVLSIWMFLAAKRKKWIAKGFHSLTPCMTFKDSRQAIDFYKRVFGAKTTLILHEPNGQGIRHAEMRMGNSILMMGDERIDQNCKSAQTLGGSPMCLYLYVKHVDGFFKRVVDGGATVEMPPQDMFWGDRVCKVKDPFGYTWMFATNTKDISAHEIKKCAEIQSQGK